MENFNNIVYKENKDKKIIKELQSKDLPIILYGYGDTGKAIISYLNYHNIKLSAIMVDAQYCISNQQYEGLEIYSIDEIQKKYRKFFVIIGFVGFVKGICSLKKIENIEEIYCISNPYLYLKKEELSWQYFLDNKKHFYESYSLFDDELSKSIFVDYINTRINNNAYYLFPYGGCNNYYNNEIVKLSNKETYVDCGAYNGDTVEKFLQNVNNSFRRIYALEADKKNYENMCYTLSKYKLENIYTINKGIWSYQGSLSFKGNIEQESSIYDNKDTSCSKINVDTLDNILKDDFITLIKMSIQGSELQALKGAIHVIQKNKPRLAMAIFMKRDALINLPKFIKHINPNYKLYLRCDEPFFARVTLYAVE